MNCEKKYKQWIWLAPYGELTKNEREELSNHLKSCASCQKEMEEATHLYQQLLEKEKIQISESELQQTRNMLFHRIRMAERYGIGPIWLQNLRKIFTLEFHPGMRIATALGMLLIGIFLGGKFFSSHQNYNPEMAANSSRQIREIENVYFDEQNKKVLINYLTVENKMMSGKPDDPKIQDLLAQTLITDTRPNIRLRSVNALSETKSLHQKVLEALIEVLEKDENSGVRLKTIKILNAIPWNESVRLILTKVFIKALLQEKNPAIRIEALEGLERLKGQEMTGILNKAAKNDSNAYIRNKANLLLGKLKKQPQIVELNRK